MDKFNTMLNRLGLRGASDEGEIATTTAAGRRSTQSTPKAGRTRLHSAGDTHAVVHSSQQPPGQQTYGSLGSMEPHLIHRRPRDRSWESERTHNVAPPPRGLNRMWEVERRRGMELLQQSVEREKVRRGQKGTTGTAGGGREKRRRQKKRVVNVKPPEVNREPPVMHVDTTRFSQERLEKRVKELNRQLLEEKQTNRRDKLTVVRLQREIARQKSDGPLRETLMLELEEEQMLRESAEQELQKLSMESDKIRGQHRALQEEYRKMEEMARTMGRYGNNLEQLKREKSMLTISYESNLQKCRAHISNLELENKLLTAEVQKLESQLQSSESSKDLSYRVSSKLTTCSQSDGDRCKVLLERLKMLESEKSALVLENERQRAQYEEYLDEIANQVVQALMSQKSLREECAKLQRRVIDLEYQNRQLHHMFQQRIRFASDSVLQSVPGAKSAVRGGGTEGRTTSKGCQQAQSRAPRHPDQGKVVLHATASPFSEVSLESLQSMCSNNSEAIQMEESLGQPELCSPPPWLREKLLHGDSLTSSLSSPIPTEHPSLAPSMKQLGQSPSVDETAASAIARYLAGIKPAPDDDQGQMFDSQCSVRHVAIPSTVNPASFHQQSTRQDVLKNPVSELPFAVTKGERPLNTPHGSFAVNQSDGLTVIDRFAFIGDDSGSSSPIGANNLSSVGSTVSLNELLENGFDGRFHEDFFSEDNRRFDDESSDEEVTTKQETNDCSGSTIDDGLTDVMWEEEDGIVGSPVYLPGAGEAEAGIFMPIETGPVLQEPSHVRNSGSCVNEYSSSESDSDTKVKCRVPLTEQTHDVRSNSIDGVNLRNGQVLSNNFTGAGKTTTCQNVRAKQKPAVKPKPVFRMSTGVPKAFESDASRAKCLAVDNWTSPDRSTGETVDRSQSPDSFHSRLSGNAGDVATGNSPDSVMQTSYSSSSDSEIIGSDKVTSRDDGYSSNSAVSVNACKQPGCKANSEPSAQSQTIVCALHERLAHENEAMVTETLRSPVSANDGEYKRCSVKDIRASFESAAPACNRGEAPVCRDKKQKRPSAKQSTRKHHSGDYPRNVSGTCYSDSCLNISPFAYTRCHAVLHRSCSEGALCGRRLAYMSGARNTGSGLSPIVKRYVDVAITPGGRDGHRGVKIGRHKGSPRSLGEGAENGYCSWENLKPKRPAAIGSERLDGSQIRNERRWNHHQAAIPSMHFLADITESESSWDRPRSVDGRPEATIGGRLKIPERSAAWEGSLEEFEAVYQEAMSSPHSINGRSSGALMHDLQDDLCRSHGDISDRDRIVCSTSYFPPENR